MTTYKRLGTIRDGIFPYETAHAKKKRWGVEFEDPRTGVDIRRLGFLSRTEANEFLAHVERVRMGVEPAGGEPMLFDHMVRRFLREYRSRSGEIEYYRQQSQAWLSHFAGKQARLIRLEDVDEFKRMRLDKVSPSTVRQNLVSLGTLFRWAKARDLVTSNPAAPAGIRRPSSTRPHPNPLTQAEEAALLDRLWGDTRPIVQFCIATGADRNEAVGLQWHAVDHEQMVIYLPRSKTGTPRALPYRQNSTLRWILARPSTGRVFSASYEGAKTQMRRAWEAVIVGKTRPWKSLRATFASRQAAKGTPVPLIAELMGLTTSHVLEHYVKASGRHLENALRD